MMRLRPGLSVLTSDEVEIGTVVEIEKNAEGSPIGIILELKNTGGRESRLPIAWITGVTDSTVHLIVASSEIIRPRPLDLFNEQSGNIFGRDPF
jgi:hypothetical protein